MLSPKKVSTSSVDYLRQIRAAAIDDGKSNDQCTDQIVAALGGIDQIVNDYLYDHETNNSRLSEAQASKLVQILSPNALTRLVTLTSFHKASVTPSAEHKAVGAVHGNEFVYNIDMTDCLLKSFFGVSTAVISTIISIVYHKYAWIVLVALGIVWSTFFLKDNGEGFWYKLVSFVWFPVSFWHMTWVVLTANTLIVNLSIKTFEFWLKIFYAVAASMLLALHAGFTDSLPERWAVFPYYANKVQVVVVVVVVSLSDALPPVKKWIKVCAHCIVAFMISFVALEYTLQQNRKSNADDGIYVMQGVNLHLLDYAASSYRFLSIFLWKSAALYFWKKYHCINISSPYIAKIKHVSTRSRSGDNTLEGEDDVIREMETVQSWTDTEAQVHRQLSTDEKMMVDITEDSDNTP